MINSKLFKVISLITNVKMQEDIVDLTHFGIGLYVYMIKINLLRVFITLRWVKKKGH